jgi:hypothetical protein
MTWDWTLWLEGAPLLVGLGLGLILGRLWGQAAPPPPPAVNPWAVRACREWDGGERWT